MTSVYYAIPPGPMGALPELGPGTPSLPSANPIGSGIVVATSSTATAAVELRVLDGTTGPLTTMNIINALERLRYFLRQRGYVGGSGGPSGNPPTNTQVVGKTPV